MHIVQASDLFAGTPMGLKSLVLLERPTAGPVVRLAAVGDVGLSGRIRQAAERSSYAALFSEVAPVLQSADLAFVNIEFPLAGAAGGNGMFCGDPASAHALRDAGFVLAQLANNHGWDFGAAGLDSTLKAVRDAGMVPLGAGADSDDARRLVRTDRNGLRIGWLAAGRTLVDQDGPGPRYWEYDEDQILRAIEKARGEVDVLVLGLHVGLMYLDYPDPRFKRFAQQAMSAGADLVLMHHAHLLQSTQVTPEGRVCLYCMGNFLLDWREGNVEVRTMAREQAEAGVFLFDLDRRGVATARMLPTFIDEDGCVRWATGPRGDRILERLVRISRDIESDYQAAFGRQRVLRNAWPVAQVLAFHAARGHWRIVLDMLRRVRPEHAAMLWRFVSSRAKGLVGLTGER
jgi:poly-gamma-glutamate synthesis protein (capsule biosynthesis protein)